MSSNRLSGKRLVVALVHPSNYDHGWDSKAGSFVQTYWRGVMPCNTLRLLESLTRDVLGDPAFDAIETEVHAFEEGIRGQQAAFKRLLKRFPEPGTTLVVGMVAVQTNQMPRACDLMEAAKARGAMCVIGGPHVTASINASLHGISKIDPMRAGVPCPGVMPPEIVRLMEDPQTVVFHGDADSGTAWREVLVEILEKRSRRYYEAGLAGEISDPGAIYTSKQLDAYGSAVAAVDTERGCPFKCKFCAAIQAHGRQMRSRDPHRVIDWVRRQCESYRKPLTVLFATDNLARNPHWRELLGGLAQLRKDGYDFTIWAEADVLCNSGPNAGFLEAFAAAGGHGLFLGIESMNPDNIRMAGKNQNVVEHLPAFFAECRRHGVAPEGGYIIGFPYDTPESIARDVQVLADAGLARAWFFIKTLLPGSQDWVEAIDAAKPMDADLNNYDSTRVTTEHELMTEEQWAHSYWVAVSTFFSASNMIKVLSQYDDNRARWRLIRGCLWCRWAYLTEKSHPMIAGLYRFRPWGERRPGQKPITLMRYWASEARRHLVYLGAVLREFYVFQHVILEAEWRLRCKQTPALANDICSGVRGWFRYTFLSPMRRAWLNDFWVRYGKLKWRLLSPLRIGWHVRAGLAAFSEVVYTARFLFKFVRDLHATP